MGALRGPAWRYRDLVEALGERVCDEAKFPGPPPLPWADEPLRPYQEAALDAWRVAGRGRRGVVALPTGSGKTRLAIAAMARSGMRSLVLVPTRVLLEQWLREIRSRYAGPVGCCGDGQFDLAAVTVTTFESAYRHMDELGNRFELLVVDEAHHFGSGVRDEALEMSLAPNRLGLTATPPTGAAGARLAELVGPTIFQMSIADLAGRFLARFDAFTLPVELTATERADYDALMATYRAFREPFLDTRPDATWEEFTREAQKSVAGRRALGAWRDARKLLHYPDGKRSAVASLLERHREGGARILIFTADNETAYAIAREHLVMPLTCDIVRKERDGVLARFRTGELRALVSARVLNEGIDVPDADVAIILGGTFGEREHVQRVGRLLRPRDGKRAQVYELVCPRTTEERTAQRRRRGLDSRIAS